MPATYEPIQTYTASGSQSAINFTSIGNSYTDLELVVVVNTLSAGGALQIRLNSDSANNYSTTRLYGNGSSASSDRVTNTNYLLSWGASTFNPVIYKMSLLNYSNTTTNKTSITRISNSGEFVASLVGLWRSTSAITSINCDLGGANFPSGSTFTLYGIKAA